MNKIILLVRRDRDYYINQVVSPVVKSGERVFSKNLNLWNFFFKIPYVEFRRRLSEVSSLTYSQNSFDKIYFWGDYEAIEKEPDGSIIVPIDEDDWISNTLADDIRNFDFKDKQVTKWDVINIGPKGDSSLERRNLCRSCSYAVKLPYHISFISINVLMTRNQRDIIKFNKTLSAKVDNIATRTFLGNNYFDYLLEIVKKRHQVKKTKLLQGYEEQVDIYNKCLIDLYDSCKL